MPGILWVPASSRSGRKSGISCWIEMLPVPPSSSVRTGTSFPHSSTPVPWGPYRPLWPGMAMKAAPRAVMSRVSIPADWDASMMKGTSRSRQIAAIASTGWTKPNTLDTWLQITASVPGTIRRSKAAVTAAG